MTRYLTKISVFVRADSKKDAERITTEFFEAIIKEVPDEMPSLELGPTEEHDPKNDPPSCGGCVIP